jgi:O-acetyl-ADP-ribose deacetylase (regulator of RNase III)
MGNVCDPPHLEYTTSATVFSECVYSGVRISVLQGDICEEDVDIIVNVSNPHLQIISGISKNIITKAGREVESEMKKIMNSYPHLNIGTAIHTGAGDLECDYIIHAVVPTWNGGNAGEREKLEQTMKACLVLSNDLKATSISIPSLSSGIVGFPKDFCAEIMMSSLRKFLVNDSTNLTAIRLINTDNPTVRLFKRAFEFEFMKKPDERKKSEEIIELFDESASRRDSLKKYEEINFLKTDKKNNEAI